MACSLADKTTRADSFHATRWTFVRAAGDDEALQEIESQFPSVSSGNADVLYEREWAAALLRQAVDRVAQESALKGKAALFQASRSYLLSGDAAVPCEQIARQLNRGIVTLLKEVRGTLSDHVEAADELAYLCQVLVQA